MIPILSDVGIRAARPAQAAAAVRTGQRGSDSQITRFRSAYGLVDRVINIEGQPGPVIDEVVAQYREEAAAMTYLAELRYSLANCPDREFVEGARSYARRELVATDLAGQSRC
jgi:hypothetical protein